MTDTQPSDQALRGFPYMSLALWGQIRSRLKRGLPSTINNDWLQSVLGITQKGARNLIPQLRRVGLIDKDGVLQQPLVNDFREDDTYSAACGRMIEAIYPPSLLDAFPEPHEDPDGVAGWFRRNANTGDAMASLQAKFLAGLSRGDLPDAAEAPRRGTARTTTSNPTSATKAAVALTKPKQAEVQRRTGRLPTPENPTSPTVHIDVQIHIDADAQADQIDAVFASMARHLYGK